MYFHFRHQIYIIASLLLNAPLISVLQILSSVLCYSLILHNRFCFKFQTVVNVKMDNRTFDLGDIEDIEIIDQTWDANNIIVKIKPKEEDLWIPAFWVRASRLPALWVPASNELLPAAAFRTSLDACSVSAARSCSVLAYCSLLAAYSVLPACSLLASHQQDPSGYN